MSQEIKQQTQAWLEQYAVPLWLKKGRHPQGGFYEAMSLEGQFLDVPRRLMVQARQIFSSQVAFKLGILSEKEASEAIRSTADLMLNAYSLPSGAFAHAVDTDLKPVAKPADLYAQAFALFGLGYAYSTLQDAKYKDRALLLVKYLDRERRAPLGGFTELNEAGVLYEANPLMHLFEALLLWCEVDKTKTASANNTMDTPWRPMADEIAELCLRKFIEPNSSLLAEHYDVNWSPRTHEGRYLWEPGHHYEWAWLLGLYQKSTKTDLLAVRLKLYKNAETYGIHSQRGSAYDEVWSDLMPAKRSGRFWPQCERVKAALQLAKEDPAHSAAYLQAADHAMLGLFRFLEVTPRGLWFDLWKEDGEFVAQPARASSLYHIIGAMADYLLLR